MRRVRLHAVRPGVVENLGAVAEGLDNVVDLLNSHRAGLGKGHAAHRRALDVRSRDGVLRTRSVSLSITRPASFVYVTHLVDLFGDLTTAMRELADDERAMRLRNVNRALQARYRVPRRAGINDGVLGRLEVGARDGEVAQHDHADGTLAPFFVELDVLGRDLASLVEVLGVVRAKALLRMEDKSALRVAKSDKRGNARSWPT